MRLLCRFTPGFARTTTIFVVRFPMREPTYRLRRGEALISAVLMSLGLWALIWGAIYLLAV
jgi:hypothetical protein